MTASKQDVDRWIETAKKRGSKYIVSVCDTWDWEDFPIYCANENERDDAYAKNDNVNMQRINEVINID